MPTARRAPLAVLCAVLSAAPAVAQDALARLRAAGTVRVGFPNQVPYAYADEAGKLTGADAEIARFVFARMGVRTVDGVLTEFAALIPGLRARRFDTVLAMFVTPAHCAQVAFSEPIYAIGQGMVVKDGNPAGIAGYGDFAFRPAGAGLQAAFNAALAELKAAPEFLAAMAPFGFTQANLPDRTTDALCH